MTLIYLPIMGNGPILLVGEVEIVCSSGSLIYSDTDEHRSGCDLERNICSSGTSIRSVKE